jgi:hypothetical protein
VGHLAGQKSRHDQPGRVFARQVLATVDRQVGFAAQERLLELGREQALPTLLAQRPIRLLVAGGHDRQEVAGRARQLFAQARRHHLGLDEGERTFARGDDESHE